MEQYIPKSALVAEIKSRISDIELSQKVGLIKKRDANKKILLFKSVLSLIDTIEVKEVQEEQLTRSVTKTSDQEEPVSEDKIIISKEWFEHCKKSWYNEGYIDGEYNRDRQFEEPVNEDLK